MKNNDLTTLNKYGWLHFYQMDSIFSDGAIYDPVIIKRGNGIYVYDQNDKEYIDAISGAYCVNVGYGRSSIIEAASRSAMDIHYVSPFSSANIPAIHLSKKLANLTETILGQDARVFFVNSGSEAVETAVKIARSYSRRTTKPDAFKVICRQLSYHGTTFGALSFCGFDEIKTEYEPLLPGIYHIENTNCSQCMFGLTPSVCNIKCAESAENLISENNIKEFSAVLIEPFETSSGMVPPPKHYLQKIRKICDKYDLLLIFDEVITGFGRFGTWFAAEYYGVQPDIIVCAKGLTSGYESLGAVIVKKEIADVFLGNDQKMFQHGATFGGRPAAAAAALENIRLIENENLLKNVQELSPYLKKLLQDKLSPLKIVGDIRGEGFLFGIDLVIYDKNATLDPEIMAKIRARLIEKGLITSLYYTRSAPIIELAPPLMISKFECEKIVEILLDVLKIYN